MTWFEIIALTISGMLAGFINTLAGGGSIITFSVLIMLGLPPAVANGTNRINVLIQTITATTSFKLSNVLDTRKALILGLPAVIGSIAGAWIAADLNKEIFEKVVGALLLVLLVVILINPSAWVKEKETITRAPVTWRQIVVFFLIGIYGGFLQIGVGYFLLAGIVLGAGYDLVRANAIKVLIVLLYTPFAMIVFLLNHQIHWGYGLMMTAGTVAGSYLAAQLAVKRGAVFVTWVMIVFLLLTAADLFGIIDIKGIILQLQKI